MRGGGTMLTKQEFSNFTLKAGFRAHPDINSGITLSRQVKQKRAGHVR